MSNQKVTNVLTIRLTDDDASALERLCARMPVVQRARLARECLRLGLAALEADPTRLVRPTSAPAEPDASIGLASAGQP